MIEVDFHIHSKYSFDSLLSPRAIVRTALKKRLLAVAIADHNTVKGALEVAREAAKTDLVVIPAIELETDGGHIMSLFVETDIKTHNIDEVLDEIKRQQGVSALLHPARMRQTSLREVASKVDVIETLNGRTRRHENAQAKSLAFEFQKPAIAGSDAHLSFEIGCVRTLLDGTPNTLEDLRKHMLKGKRMLDGKESSYLVHALSFGTQLVKSASRRF
jgi:predicted metal-dependent phosphoesterase TrpH